MRRRAAVLIALAALAAGCSQRDRANPFDPANPLTGGRPAGFAALAGDGQVTLRWVAAGTPGLLGYQLFRSLASDTGFTAITDLLPAGTSGFSDPGLLNGTDHFYRLYFVFDRGLSPLFAADVATPGPLRPWVTDDGLPALDQITADGRRIVQAVSGAARYTAGDVAVDGASHAVWACDPDFGQVAIYQPSSATLTRATSGIGTPVSIGVNPVDHTAWVGDDAAGTVLHMNPDGSQIANSAIASVQGPFGLTLDPVDHSVWVCERWGDRVRHADGNGLPLAVGFVLAPSRVAVDSTTHEAWVTSFSRGKIVHLSAAGARLDSVASVGAPLNLVVDARRGRIWVTDPIAGQLVALRRNGTTERVVGGIAGANDIALDPASGEVWVTATDARRLVRVSASGTILLQAGGFSSPNAIALDPGNVP